MRPLSPHSRGGAAGRGRGRPGDGSALRARRRGEPDGAQGWRFEPALLQWRRRCLARAHQLQRDGHAGRRRRRHLCGRCTPLDPATTAVQRCQVTAYLCRAQLQVQPVPNLHVGDIGGRSAAAPRSALPPNIRGHWTLPNPPLTDARFECSLRAMMVWLDAAGQGMEGGSQSKSNTQLRGGLPPARQHPGAMP